MSQRIHLDATPGLFHQVLHCHQGDVGRQFEIAVVTRDGYEIPSGATFKIQATKPSGLGFTVTGTAANNIISFTSTEDMTSEAGEIPTQLEIKSGNDVIYTSNFLLVCEKNTHPESVTDGSPEEIISEITLLVERAESAASTAGADAASAAQARVDEMMDYLPSEVADLKSDYDYLEEELNADNEYVSKPLTFSVVPNEYVRSSGAISVDSDHEWSRTDKISVVGYSEITGVNSATGFQQNAFYNSDDQMVQYFVLASGVAKEVPNNATYVVFSGPHAQINTAHFYGKKRGYANNVQEEIANIKDGVLLQSQTQVKITNSLSLPVDMYTIGSLSDDGLYPDTYRATYRASSKQFECNKVDVIISAKTGNKFGFHSFSADGENIGWSGWLTDPTLIKAGTIYKTILDCSVADLTLEERLACFNFTTIDDEKCADGPFIFQCRDGRVNNSVPPNSVYAIRATALNQYDRMRLSVTKTADNQYVCVHDTYINDLAVNQDGTTITPNIETASLTVAQLNQYDWGLKFGEQYRGLSVPILEDCLLTASKYNIKVTLDFKWTSSFSDDDVDAIVTLLAKTGQLDCILCPLTITTYQKFHAKSGRISYYFCGTEQQVISQASALKLLQTSFNSIYIQPAPFGDLPSEAFINLCAENDFKLYMTPIEGIDTLMSIGFNRGISLFECHYIEKVKSTVKAYNDLSI